MTLRRLINPYPLYSSNKNYSIDFKFADTYYLQKKHYVRETNSFE